MAYKYIGDATIGVGLTVNTRKPLDSRLVVNSRNDLYSIPASTAYQGMTVSSIQDGNMYMLMIDPEKSPEKISDPLSWKASYESLQIITCSQTEYDTWSKNTGPDNNPLNPELPYIYPNTYYYTYDGNEDQQYLSAAWGKDIIKSLESKASLDLAISTKKSLSELATNLTTNYSTTEVISSTYVPLTSLNLEDPESFLSQTLSKYYTSQKADAIFVTKESLRGGIEGGQDDFVFVTKTQYDSDQQSVQQVLDTTLKTDSDGALNSITVAQIKSKATPEGKQLIVNLSDKGLSINNDLLATKSEVPVIVTISDDEFKILQEGQKVDPETYYYVYNTKDTDQIYITRAYLKQMYDDRSTYQGWCYQQFYKREETQSLIETSLTSYAKKTDLETIQNWQQNAESIYATNVRVETIETDLSKNYVTKSMLQSSESMGDSDFIFVKQSAYEADKQIQAQQFKSNIVETKQLKLQGQGNEVNTVTLTSGNLVLGEKQMALKEDVPQIICLSEKEYEKLESKDINTYYYTYNSDGGKTDGYVPMSLLTSSYYKKSDVDAKISTLEKKVSALTVQMQEIWNFFSNSAISQITDETLISNITIIAKNEHN